MLATNHAITGALIASMLPLPIAVPVAFASHFVLDAIPHYGISSKLKNHSKIYKTIVFSDILIALIGSLCLAVLHKWRMEVGAWVSWSPDLLWVVYYFTHSKTLRMHPTNWFMDFHLKIQWCERPWGIIVEFIYFFAFLPVYLMQTLK